MIPQADTITYKPCSLE